MELKAIIVDDEERARDVLSNLLSTFCKNVSIIASYGNVEQAVAGIKDQHPDIVFLDIEMPKYAGYEIVEFFEETNFEIVFVTAYDQYAIKAFEISAVDYLLKPVDIERLKDAVSKAQHKIENQQHSHQYKLLKTSLTSEQVEQFVVTEKGEQHIIQCKDVIAIEAQESYSNIYTLNNKYIASKNLKHFERLLESNNTFFRTHKSWLINLNQLIKFSKSKGEIDLQGNIKAKLSKYRIEEFVNLL